MESETSEKERHRGGQVIRYEPTSTQEILSSPFIRKSFEDASCLVFYQRIEQLKFHDKLTSAFATKLRRDKVTIAGFEFVVSRKIISTTQGLQTMEKLGSRKEILTFKVTRCT